MAPQRVPKSAIEAFGAGVLVFLKEHADVKPLLGGFYDQVPADKDRPRPPYLYLGPASRRRAEIECTTLWDVRLRLFIASTAFGRYEAWGAAEAVVAALDRNDTLELAAPYRRSEIVRCLQDGDVVDPSDPKIVFVDLSTVIIRD